MQLTIHTDGGARGNPGPSAIGVVVHDEKLNIVHEHKAFLGTKTNNEAEYEALLYATEWLSRFQTTQSVQRCIFLLDSLLVVSQVKRQWKVKEARLLSYQQKITQIFSSLPFPCEIKHVPREDNSEADALVNQSLDEATRN